MTDFYLESNKKPFPKNSKVLVRVDFNVPIKNNIVIDNSRILLSIPTIKLLLKNNNALVLISHLGRPKSFEKKLSMKIVKNNLKKIPFFKTKIIHFCESLEINDLENKKKNLKLGEILVLENLRFDEGERGGSLLFAKKISSNMDFFINDAFAVCHRNDASVTKIPSLFNQKKLAGLLIQKEIHELNKVINTKKKKLAIIGGAKISTKVTLIKKLVKTFDNIIIGGAMAFSFVKYLGGSIGLSLHESDQLNEISIILKNAKKNNCNIHLPIDIITIKKNNTNITYKRKIHKIPNNEIGLDIGPESCDFFKSVILKSKTIIWNGPMGMFEKEGFKFGTEKVLLSISSATKDGSYSLVGGGDTLSAISNYKKDFHNFNFMSTGGGAMLAFLQNPDLPGIKALEND